MLVLLQKQQYLPLTQNNTMKIDPKYLNTAISYSQYKQMVIDLLEKGKVTGPIQNDELVHYTQLNIQRMNRVEKTTVLTEELKIALSKITKPQTWLALSEGWCGDASQLIPVFSIIEQHCSMIKFRILLRDEQPELMDQFLTNGSRSIPIVLFTDTANHQLLAKWGPRPAEATALMSELKAAQTDYPIIKEKLHLWYAKNKSIALQNELAEIINNLILAANTL